MDFGWSARVWVGWRRCEEEGRKLRNSAILLPVYFITTLSMRCLGYRFRARGILRLLYVIFYIALYISHHYQWKSNKEELLWWSPSLHSFAMFAITPASTSLLGNTYPLSGLFLLPILTSKMVALLRFYREWEPQDLYLMSPELLRYVPPLPSNT